MKRKRWTTNSTPIDNLEVLVQAKIPIIHVVGDADEVVPVEENTNVVEERYKIYGGVYQVIRKPGGLHHPHSLDDPTPIVRFLSKYSNYRVSVPFIKRVKWAK